MLTDPHATIAISLDRIHALTDSKELLFAIARYGDAVRQAETERVVNIMRGAK